MCNHNTSLPTAGTPDVASAAIGLLPPAARTPPSGLQLKIGAGGVNVAIGVAATAADCRQLGFAAPTGARSSRRVGADTSRRDPIQRRPSSQREKERTGLAVTKSMSALHIVSAAYR
jgi:hypothetical protein